jgi:putative membrane protein
MSNGLDLSWPWNPIPLIGLIILCLLYGFGIRQAHKSGKQNAPLKKICVIAFITAVALTAIVFLTPLYTIARTQLFSAHMVQAVTLKPSAHHFCSLLLRRGFYGHY